MWIFILSAAAASADEKGGFPAFEFWHWQSQIIWVIISFALMYMFLSRAVLPTISNTLENRADRIQSDLDEAEKLAMKVAKLDEALELERAQARATAKENETNMKRELDAELAYLAKQREKDFAEKLGASDARMQKLKATADKNVSDAATEITEALLSNFNVETNKRSIRDALKSIRG